MARLEHSDRPGTRTARWRPLVVLICALAFLWPAVVNGGAFLFPDSVEYIRGPDGAVGKFLGPGAKSEWSRPRPVYASMPKPQGQDEALARVPRSGRSIYYGALANLGARSGGFWLTLILQALAASYAIDLLCRALGWTRIGTFCVAVVMAALLTPLAIFASFIMADVFGAVLILAAAALAAGSDRLNRIDIALAALLITYAATTHASHLGILAAAVASAGLLLAISRRGGALRTSATVLGAVGVAAFALALLAGAAFNLMVKKAFGAPPIPVPYLTARVMEDGHPGAAWLKRRCPDVGFVACHTADRVPMPANDFLWSANPPRAAFSTASTRDQIALGNEQTRLVLTLAKEEPLPMARAFLGDWLAQLRSISLEDLNLLDVQRDYIDQLTPEGFQADWRRSMAFHQTWPARPLTAVLAATSLIALAGLAALAIQAVLLKPRPGSAQARLLSAAFVVVMCVVANAAICGGLSGVFGRYEARVLAPLILTGWFALGLALGPRRRI